MFVVNGVTYRNLEEQVRKNKEDIEGLEENKQNKLTAGTGISIVDDVISAIGGGSSDYRAGDGVTVTDKGAYKEISLRIGPEFQFVESDLEINSGVGLTYGTDGEIVVDFDYVQKTLTAGSNITIQSDGTISASVPVASVNTKTGSVVLDATDIKLTTNQQTVQANIIRVDESLDEHSDEIDDIKDRLDNMSNIGKFLAIWNATTGVATSDPPESPYAYHTGDYFRIGVEGTRIPTGAQYVTGGTNYTTGTAAVGDVFYYDGTVWRKQAAGAGGNVMDVQVNGTSILSSGIANVQLKTINSTSISGTGDIQFDTVTVVWHD